MYDTEGRQQDFDIFFNLLIRATSNIDSHYFQLPVADRENPVYRERVYCYELYHRIREQMPDDYPYKLDGELDKNGHPLIENSVGGVKPDLLVHERGRMDRNLVAIEVKAINTTIYGINKDIRTLSGFLSKAQYFRSIYLIYGDDPNAIGRIAGIVSKTLARVPEGSFYLLWHRRSGTPAETIWVNKNSLPPGRGSAGEDVRGGEAGRGAV